MNQNLLKQASQIKHSEDHVIHKWLCHPGSECPDGCDQRAIPERLDAFQEACNPIKSLQTQK